MPCTFAYSPDMIVSWWKMNAKSFTDKAKTHCNQLLYINSYITINFLFSVTFKGCNVTLSGAFSFSTQIQTFNCGGLISWLMSTTRHAWIVPTTSICTSSPLITNAVMLEHKRDDPIVRGMVLFQVSSYVYIGNGWLTSSYCCFCWYSLCYCLLQIILWLFVLFCQACEIKLSKIIFN